MSYDMELFLAMVGGSLVGYLIAVLLLYFLLLPWLDRRHERRMDEMAKAADERWERERRNGRI